MFEKVQYLSDFILDWYVSVAAAIGHRLPARPNHFLRLGHKAIRASVAVEAGNAALGHAIPICIVNILRHAAGTLHRAHAILVTS